MQVASSSNQTFSSLMIIARLKPAGQKLTLIASLRAATTQLVYNTKSINELLG